ncbi:MAG: M24 family metallopeptidase [Candidatus Hydrogenedentes bacterium]|nr:M24 family metallopeptidase [Candidatus Hydrogenedentota bacterium]
MSHQELFLDRVALIQAFLELKGLDGLLISRVDNYAMATGGKRNFINTYTDKGANSLLIQKDGGVHFVGNGIESTRQMEEEFQGLNVGCVSFLWSSGSPAATVQEKFGGAIGSDDGALGPNLNNDLSELRAILTETELEKYRRIGQRGAEAMMATLNAIDKGTLEQDIIAQLIYEGQKRRCQVPVALVAADDRIRKFRHPLPTVAPLIDGPMQEARVERYVMVVGCFLAEGLVVSMTRFKRVDALPEGIEDAFTRICAVDAEMQVATEPGHTLGDVFTACQEAYVRYGFPPNEWHNHHQGGATGYAGRTAKGMPGATFPVLPRLCLRRAEEIRGKAMPCGAAFAWNPSAPGVKSEDTFLLLPSGDKEIITSTPAIAPAPLASVMDREVDFVKSGIAS